MGRPVRWWGPGSGVATGRVLCAGGVPARSPWRILRAASPTAPPGARVGDSTEWTFDLEPDGSETRIVQSFRVLSLPRWADLVICLLVPEHQDRTKALAADLVRLGRRAGELHPQR